MWNFLIVLYFWKWGTIKKFHIYQIMRLSGPSNGTIFLWMTLRSRNVIEAVYQVRAEAIIYRLHWLTRIVEVDWPLVTAGLKRRSWNTWVGMSKKRKKKQVHHVISSSEKTSTVNPQRGVKMVTKPLSSVQIRPDLWPSFYSYKCVICGHFFICRSTSQFASLGAWLPNTGVGIRRGWSKGHFLFLQTH